MSDRQIDIADRLKLTAGAHRQSGDERLAEECEEGAREIVNLRLRLRHTYDREVERRENATPPTRYHVRRRRFRMPRLFG